VAVRVLTSVNELTHIAARSETPSRTCENLLANNAFHLTAALAFARSAAGECERYAD